ncbi:MAG: citrate transporter [Clostridia bacterium]|nr:citrate transporter [Clostridia bacterium]
MTCLWRFIKKEPVLFASLILAVVSCFFTPPNIKYLSYIDYKTLSLLFCLMTVMSGFTKANVFSVCAKSLVNKANSIRGLAFCLVFICFFSSAIITNDVALITFVPLSIAVLKLAKRPDLIPITAIMQTVCANIGSSLTPIGNPQNIYLYSISSLTLWDIFLSIIPYAIFTVLFVILSTMLIKNQPVSHTEHTENKIVKKDALFYSLLFVLSVLAVFGIIGYISCLVILIITVLVFNRKILLEVDYSLLLTFVFFFIFVGNMGEIPILKKQIELWFYGNEVFFSAILSQFISNVPASLLLSGFTENYRSLLIGVNLGGLGTVIASMASLISYKYIAKETPEKKGFYLVLFSVVNFLLLALMLLINLILK